MELFIQLSGFILLIGTPFYLHAVVKLSGIISKEHPEWIERRGSLRFFYTGMPRYVDPNVSMAVLGVAFGRRCHELSDSAAGKYVTRIRILLPSLLTVFAGIIIAVIIIDP